MSIFAKSSLPNVFGKELRSSRGRKELVASQQARAQTNINVIRQLPEHVRGAIGRYNVLRNRHCQDVHMVSWQQHSLFEDGSLKDSFLASQRKVGELDIFLHFLHLPMNQNLFVVAVRECRPCCRISQSIVVGNSLLIHCVSLCIAIEDVCCHDSRFVALSIRVNGNLKVVSVDHDAFWNEERHEHTDSSRSAINPWEQHHSQPNSSRSLHILLLGRLSQC